MRRTALLIVGAAGALVALVLIAVAIAVATVDPNRFVAPLAARIKATTGRTLAIQGPVELKVSLEPKIALPGVAFENAPWSASREMLTAKRIDAQIALLPLLSRRFEVIEFTLIEPVITLETDATGRGNWEFASPQPPGGAAGTPAAPSTIGIGNFEIRNGTLTYRNGAGGNVTTVSIDRMTMHARDMSAPVAVDFTGRIDDLPVALSGNVGPPDQWLAQKWPYPVSVQGNVDGSDFKLATQLSRTPTATSLDALSVRFGPVAATGRIRSTRDGSRTRHAFEFDIPSLALTELPVRNESKPAPRAPAPSVPPVAASRWIVPDTTLPLGVLAAIDGEGTVAIGQLTLRDGQQLSRVAAQLASAGSIVDVKFSAASVLGGSLRGALNVDGRRPDAPAVRLQLNAQDLDLPKLAAAAGVKREIRGGKVRADVDVSGRGATPHRVASTMSGSIIIASGPALLGRSTVQEESGVSQIAGALDPFRTVDATTELRCAVFRLPLSDGIARVDRSIAIETGKIAGSASGTLNFRDETMDLSVEPQIREGVRIDVSQFASLVRIRGRFDKPSVAIDAAQSAQLIAKLGVLGAKGGGLEALGRALIAPAGDASAAPCAVAMGARPREGTSSRRPATAAQAPGVGGDVGRALGRLLGR
jgi:uncharacterized protein involved in outer membrane biogenesis